MTPEELRASVTPKSDQLNADDLIGQSRTITVTSIKAGSADQPVVIHYQGDNGRPYKPCKSMRRVLIAAWGDNGADWVGRSMTLYQDPAVKFGGVAVGGIRISHLSDIQKSTVFMLTTTRSKRSPYTVEPLVIASYPDADFDANLPKWSDAVTSGKLTHDALIDRINGAGKGRLTDDQVKKIREISAKQPAVAGSDGF